MEKFVEISHHEYMDMYPSIEVITFIGDSIEDIENKAKDWCSKMNTIYSSINRVNKVYTKEMAKAYVDKLIAIEKTHPQEDSEEFINKITNLYNKCYEEII